MKQCIKSIHILTCTVTIQKPSTFESLKILPFESQAEVPEIQMVFKTEYLVNRALKWLLLYGKQNCKNRRPSFSDQFILIAL
jgi:hypothetical protein